MGVDSIFEGFGDSSGWSGDYGGYGGGGYSSGYEGLMTTPDGGGADWGPYSNWGSPNELPGASSTDYGNYGGGGYMDNYTGMSSMGSGGSSGFGDMSSWIKMLGGLGSVATGIQGQRQAGQIQQQAAAADPMAPYRAGYAAQLAALMANPKSIQGMPGYQAGLDAIERKGAAQGFLGSGNLAEAMFQYGGNFFDQAVARLQSLAGGTAGGGLAATQSGINLTNASNNRIMSGLATALPAGADIFSMLVK